MKPKKSEEECINRTIRTYDKVAKDYAKVNAYFSEVESCIDKFMSYLKKTGGQKILDVGCGHGRDIKYLASEGYIASGIDLSKEFIKLSKKLNPKSTILQMDMRHLIFDDSSFDGIIANASVLHIPKKELPMALEGFARILKDGGYLMISIMMGKTQGYKDNKKHNWPERFFSFYQKDEFREYLESAGFEVVSYRENPTVSGKSFMYFFCKRNNRKTYQISDFKIRLAKADDWQKIHSLREKNALYSRHLKIDNDYKYYEKFGFLISTYTKKEFLSYLKVNHFYIAEYRNRIIGYIRIGNDREIKRPGSVKWKSRGYYQNYIADPHFVVGVILIDPHYRGTGLAKFLLDNAVRHIPKNSNLFSHIITHPVKNMPSIHWHIKMGFQLVGTTARKKLFGFDDLASIVLMKKV